MRISDWSSDVCSSDLSKSTTRTRASRVAKSGMRPCELKVTIGRLAVALKIDELADGAGGHELTTTTLAVVAHVVDDAIEREADRKRGGSGKSVSVRVDHGGAPYITKKTKNKYD